MPLMCDTHKDKPAKAVCQHCGRLLCDYTDLSPRPFWDFTNETKDKTLEKLCGYLLPDKYYSKTDKKPFIHSLRSWLKFQVKSLRQGRNHNQVKAYHCEDCLRAYHPEMIVALETLKAGLSYSTPQKVRGRRS